MRQRHDIPDPVVELLRSVRGYRAERRMLERRLAFLRAEAEHITARYDGQPGGGGDPHKDALLTELADRSTALDAAMRVCWKREDAVDDFIHSLPDYRHRAVLRLRYVECLSWAKVGEGLKSVGIFYEPRQVFRLHGAALQAARNAYPSWVKKHPEIGGREQ